MKSLKIIFVLLPLTFILFSSSCNKKCKNAGTGGEVVLVAKLQHHGFTIVNRASYLDTVYLKFNTSDSPGENLNSYDTYFVGEAGEDHVHMHGLKCGDYYIYGVGFDTAINDRVKGGIPYSFDKESGEIHLIIPVTED